MIGLLNKSITIKSKTQTKDSQGGFTWTWSTGTAAKSRLRQRNVKELSTADRNAEIGDYVLYVLKNVSIVRGNQVIYGSRTFDVIAVNDPHEMGDHKEIWLKEVK